MKTCTACLVELPLSAFGKRKSAKDGLNWECKPCANQRAKAWREKNPDHSRGRYQKLKSESPERLAEYRANRSRNSKYKAGQRDWHLQKLYGISLAEYETMLAAQDGVCAICGNEPAKDKNLHVDHNHTSGAIRALLCSPCNTGLGQFQEDLDLLVAAAAYLLRFENILAMESGR